MLGIADPWVALAYLLCIISALFCLIWGILKWNKDDPDSEPEDEIRHWAEEEDRVEEEL
ncbi:symporter small accessory protein [Pontiella sp.]|uniref:symporter small accessory protein n=1 Tax=Pontiella sp. TaxID=2837462 RepID=UPI003562011C